MEKSQSLSINNITQLIEEIRIIGIAGKNLN